MFTPALSHTSSPSSSNSRSRKVSGSIRSEIPTVGPRDKDFRLGLQTRKVYWIPETRKKKPKDLWEFRKCMNQDRESPKPDNDGQEDFRALVNKSGNEATLLRNIIPELLPTDKVNKDKHPDCSMSQLDCMWDGTLPLECAPGAKFRLSVPKPDETFGCQVDEFRCPNAIRDLRPYVSPMNAKEDLAFPCFTVEGKGDCGKINVSRLQNLHNGAVMVRNLLQLRKRAGIDEKTLQEEFFDRIHAITLNITKQSAELCYHWASMDSESESDFPVSFYGQPFGRWNLESLEEDVILRMRKQIRNAFDWIFNLNKSWIQEDLRKVEAKFKTLPPALRLQLSKPATQEDKVYRALTPELLPCDIPTPSDGFMPDTPTPKRRRISTDLKAPL